MTKTEKLLELARVGPFTVHDAAEYIYGSSSPNTRSAVRMLIVRLRRRGTSLVTRRGILYALPDSDTEPRKITSDRNSRKHD